MPGLQSTTGSQLPEAAEEITIGPGKQFDFGQPNPMSEAAMQRVMEILQSGRLFRYQGLDDVAEFERRVAEYFEVPFAMGCNSGGCGLFLALKALGVSAGDKVLVNAWTLAPVPGAIVHAGAVPVFVECDFDTYSYDFDDLERKAKATGAKVMIMSYMRGHVPNMDKLVAKVNELGLKVVEDAAHTWGGKWKLEGEKKHRHIGTFFDVGVWSLQTNKTINTGEGGIITTNQQKVASYITVATGTYGHFGLNGASGDAEITAKMYTSVPNFSMRMTTLAAAIALPQLDELPVRLAGWQANATILRRMLERCPYTKLRSWAHAEQGKEIIVWSSVQFELVDFDQEMIDEVVSTLGGHGIPLASFGAPWKGFTSTVKDWGFADTSGEQWRALRTANMLKHLVDIVLFHTYTWKPAVMEKVAHIMEETICCVATKHGFCTKRQRR